MKKDYQIEIEKEFERYSRYCMSKQNNRISKKIFLASARDGVKRRSSLYDNVIYWRTAEMMYRLNFKSSVSQDQIVKIKSTILATFWNDEK